MKGIRLLFFATMFCGAAPLAQAHAFLDYADPPVGGTVHGSPALVKIWFTRKIKSGASTVTVCDAQRQEVDRRDAKVDAVDPNLLVVSIPRLAAGTYQVAWQAVCRSDGHTTHGSFTFTLADP